MGIVNVTPDSFSDGGEFFDPDKAVQHAKKLVAEGADVIDIGGESTRPGSEPVSEEEEKRRVLPIIEKLHQEITAEISIDTYKPKVAEAALEKGATIINDITGLTSEAMLTVAAKFNATVVIMHMQGTPKIMQQDPQYPRGVVEEIKDFFKDRLRAAKSFGIKNIILDPGIGFGKSLEHNLTILQRLNEFNELGCPVLIGPSRKSFIATLTGGLPAAERLEGTIAAVVIGAMHGAQMVRVHDVKACRRALAVVDAVKNV